MSATLDRPAGQRMNALERANKIRLARAALKHRIARGEESVERVLLDVPECASSWPVGDLLACQRRWGTTRVRKFLARSHVLETKPVGTLTDRQRRMLATMLGAPVGVDEPSDPPPVAPVEAVSSVEAQAVVDYLTLPL